MARTANIFARVEPEIKEEAEKILNELGIPMSNAIGIFLRQVIIKKGMPFDVKLPENSKVLNYNKMTRQELRNAIDEAFDDIENGRTISAEELRKELGLL